MDKMSNRTRKLITSMISLLLLIITIFGITYAYFIMMVRANTSVKSAQVSSAILKLEYGDGNGLVELLKIKPGASVGPKTFTVTNTGTKLINSYDVILEDVINELTNYTDLTYELTCESNIGTCNGTRGTFLRQDGTILTNAIDVGETQTYNLTLYYNDTYIDQSSDMNKSISAKINIVDNDKYDAFKNIIIYGNSVQNGVPTQESPVEIKSLGDKTNNLLNVNAMRGMGINNGDGSITVTCRYNCSDSSGTLREMVPNLEIGKVYTYSFKSLNGYAATAYGKPELYSVDVGWLGFTFTLTEQIYNSKLRFYLKYNETPRTDIFYDFQINEGGTILPYEPYGKYKIPLTLDNVTTNIFLDEPLRKIGDYVDYVDIKNGKIVRNVEVIDDTGTLPIEDSLRGLDNPVIESVDVPFINKNYNNIAVTTNITPSRIVNE